MWTNHCDVCNTFQDPGHYGGNTGAMEPLPMETRPEDMQLTAEELAMADPTSYSKKYQPGSVSFKDDQVSNSEMVNFFTVSFIGFGKNIIILKRQSCNYFPESCMVLAGQHYFDVFLNVKSKNSKCN